MILKKTTQDVRYFNATIGQSTNNNIYNPQKEPTIAYFSDNRSIPILENPSEYYGSIIRFSIPLDSVPIKIIPIRPYYQNPPVVENTDPNKTIYSVTIGYNFNYSDQTYII